jgi:mono/diheme cytochrome c family protein
MSIQNIALVLLFPVALIAPLRAQQKTDVAHGKTLFEKNGCYQCHGWVGQGGLNGPRLAQSRFTQAGFIAFVRNPPSSNMPPYRAKVLSDQDLADVFAFIKSIPEPKPAKDIPLLNP